MEKYIPLLFLTITLQQTILSVDDVFNRINNDTFNVSQIKNITNLLAKFFKELYAFESIAKEPPQPSFNSNYFEKVDIYQELKNYSITGNSIPKYQLYCDLSTRIHKLNDLHISVTFNFDFNHYYYITPVILYIKMINNEPKVYIIFFASLTYIRYV